jgi:protein CpxP
MRLQSRGLALMAAAVLTLSTAALAVAQDAPPPPGPSSPGMPPMADDGPGGPDGPRMMMRHHRMDPEARAQHLRDVLQLRPDQDAALKAYLAATGPKDWSRDGSKAANVDGPPKTLTTPERLDRETEHLARAKARIDATRAFYAALSPSQKKAFDVLGPTAGDHGPRMRHVEFRRFRGGPDGAPGKAKGD